jgi:16S rRNA (guanine966-N2)-methyltransferase
MRIIGGTSRGRRLITPKKDILRPTSDRVKESLFNMLGREVEGKVVLDLFAGTGNLGIEALSRGAKKAVFVEKSRDAFKLIQRNLSMCHMEDRSEVLLNDVDQAIRTLRRKGDCFDLILMDPPYEKGLIEKTLKGLDTETIYHEGSILVIEHHRRELLPDGAGGWNLIRQRRMSDTLISILIPIL